MEGFGGGLVGMEGVRGGGTLPALPNGDIIQSRQWGLPNQLDLSVGPVCLKPKEPCNI